MSVWKRLANIAKGQVKVWQNGPPKKDAVLDAEIAATARANAARADAERTKAEGAARRWERDVTGAKGGVQRDPSEEPVPRTDLLPPQPTAEPEDEAPRRDLAPDAPLEEEAGQVMDAVTDLLDSVPSPFETAEPDEATWDLLPPDVSGADTAPLEPDEPDSDDIVDADEVERKL